MHERWELCSRAPKATDLATLCDYIHDAILTTPNGVLPDVKRKLLDSIYDIRSSMSTFKVCSISGHAAHLEPALLETTEYIDVAAHNEGKVSTYSPPVANERADTCSLQS